MTDLGRNQCEGYQDETPIYYAQVEAAETKEKNTAGFPKILGKTTRKDTPSSKNDPFFDDLFCELFLNQPHKKQSKLDNKHPSLDSDRKSCDGCEDEIPIYYAEIENTEFSATNRHVGLHDKMIKKVGVGVNQSSKHRGPVATITKQLMGYVTVKNIEIGTSYLQQNWATFALKELIDNAYDWLNDHYPARKPEDKEIRKIGVRIWITTDCNNNKFIHIAVRNSNVDNIPAFSNLDKTFDFNIWYSTKRNQHRMTSGSLGDALKRCLGMGFASWSSDYEPAADETFEEDRQWNEPVIIRRNGCEFKVFIRVDTAREDIDTEILEEKPTRDIGIDTETEVTLPTPKNSFENDEYWLSKLKQYYYKSKIAKFRTTFEFYCE